MKLQWLQFHRYQPAPTVDGETDSDKEMLHVQDVKQSKIRSFWQQNSFTIINVFVLCVNVVLSVANWQVTREAGIRSVDYVIPPLRKIISYATESTDVGIGITSPFGIDTPATDALWKEISQDGPYGWVSVQKEDLDKINQTSVALTDGSGYLVGLEVFHELHCLNWFRRKVLGKDFEPMEDPQPEYHLAHCTDILRLSIMCHADLSIMPLRWVEDYPYPWPVFQTTRQCRNWDDIMDWTKENSIGAAGRTIHPQLGLVKPGTPIDPETIPKVGRVKYLQDL